ncbi:MAG: hypothetical protein ABI475_02975, partial [Methylophilaceae bacterium]
MLIFIVGLAATAYMMNALNANTIKIERDKKTTDALAEAKEALIGWAVKRNTPGQMPCPEDTTKIGLPTEGQAQSSCTLPAIGRLPWHTLGIGDIRDGNGDKLWYALSAGFRTGIINSDTPAQLTVDGTAGKAVAIIFSPGPVLIGQSRSVPTAISPPDVTQYLDLSNNDGDNTFVSTGAAASFNDHLLLIDHDKLFRVVEKRVAREALNCLEIFAAGSGGKYPWPAKLDPSAVVDYTYDVGTLFGRLPDSPMGGAWSGACNIPVGGTGWWLSWKEQVFFTVADEYKPTGAATVCGACLAVNPPSASGDKKIVVIVAGKALTGQSRT